eukprot:6880336-Pyramimonas_sp.AAC.1
MVAKRERSPGPARSSSVELHMDVTGAPRREPSKATKQGIQQGVPGGTHEEGTGGIQQLT